MKDKRLWIIFLIIFVNLLGFGIILPLLPYYAESFGAGPMTIGLLSGAYSLFQLVSAPILGELSDKYGRRPVLLFSIGGTALSFFIMGFARSIPMLFLARIIDGASGGNISTAQAYISDITSKKDRTQSMGVMMAAFGLGMVLGPALGGLLSVYGYALPAYVAGFVALLATVLTWLFLPESRKSQVSAVKSSRIPKPVINLRDFYDALTHPKIGLLLTISFMMMFASSLMQGTFALFSEHSLHLTAKTIGIIFAYVGLIGVLMQLFFLRKILSRIPEHRIVILSIVCLAFSLGMIALSSNMVLLLIAVTIFAFGSNISGPVIAGLVSKLTPENEQGNIAGMNQSVGSMARLFGPVIGTFIYGRFGLKSPFFMATVILVFTVFFAARRLKPVPAVNR